MSITNTIAKAHLGAYEAQGTVADMIRKAVQGKKWEQVGEAYGQLLNEYGKRSRIKGTKEFSPSTPADTFNTQVQSVTTTMKCGKLRPVLIETENGEKWGLEPVTSKRTSSQKAKKLETIRSEHVAMMQGRTFDERYGELIKFAAMLGISLESATISQIKPNKPEGEAMDEKLARLVKETKERSDKAMKAAVAKGKKKVSKRTTRKAA